MGRSAPKSIGSCTAGTYKGGANIFARQGGGSLVDCYSEKSRRRHQSPRQQHHARGRGNALTGPQPLFIPPWFVVRFAFRCISVHQRLSVVKFACAFSWPIPFRSIGYRRSQLRPEPSSQGCDAEISLPLDAQPGRAGSPLRAAGLLRGLDRGQHTTARTE